MCNNVSQSCNFIQAVDKIISTFHWQEQSSVLYISIVFFMYEIFEPQFLMPFLTKFESFCAQKIVNFLNFF